MTYMYRTTVVMTPEQVEFLKGLPGKQSEHIRRAIDKYIEEVKKLQFSPSPSHGTTKTGR